MKNNLKFFALILRDCLFMELSYSLVTERLELSVLQPSDVSEDYMRWMLDPEVVQFLESRFSTPQTFNEISDFVKTIKESEHSILFGIFCKVRRQHIGNIKIGPIIREHARADIGFIIGEKQVWGQGYASEAISAVVRFGFDELGLEKMTAGCYETNLGSAYALSKAGFTHEATIPSHCISGGKRIASFYFGVNK